MILTMFFTQLTAVIKSNSPKQTEIGKHVRMKVTFHND